MKFSTDFGAKILDEYVIEVAIQSIANPKHTTFVVKSREEERFVNEIHDHRQELRSSNELPANPNESGRNEEGNWCRPCHPYAKSTYQDAWDESRRTASAEEAKRGIVGDPDTRPLDPSSSSTDPNPKRSKTISVTDNENQMYVAAKTKMVICDPSYTDPAETKVIGHPLHKHSQSNYSRPAEQGLQIHRFWPDHHCTETTGTQERHLRDDGVVGAFLHFQGQVHHYRQHRRSDSCTLPSIRVLKRTRW